MNHFIIPIFFIALPLFHANAVNLIPTSSIDQSAIEKLKSIEQSLSFSIDGSVQKKITKRLDNGEVEVGMATRPNEDRILNLKTKKAHFIGIADGTCGTETAKILTGAESPLHTEYENATDLNSLCQTIQEKHLKEVRSSSTLNCLIKDTATNKKSIINVGDSRCYIIKRNGQLLRTEIHNATNTNEVARMRSNPKVLFTDDKNKGKYFTYNSAEFQLSRAFGFQPGVIKECAPEPDTYTLEDDHIIAIILSDGLENAGQKKAYNDLPEFAKPNCKENNLHASFIYKLITILINEKTESCIKDKVREEFNNYDIDDKSMVFIPIHKL